MNKLDFSGKTAVVTGGMQGIGAAIVARLEASGAKVRIWDLDADPRVDVADPAGVERATRETLAALGRIDVLVNNAGVAGLNKPTVDYPVEEWERVLRVNLTSQFLCCRAVAPHMVKAGYGRIVNIASIAGKEGNERIAAYASAKAGVIGFTKSVARELVETGILVNAVAPALTETDLFREMPPEHVALARSRIPMKRTLKVPEVAAMVAWIASPECTFTTGFTFDLTGGRATY